MAYALVQSRSVQGNGTTSLALAFTSNVVANNHSVVASGNNTAEFQHTITDSQANTYQTDADNNTGTSGVNSYINICSATLGSSAADTVTVTTGGGNFPVVAIHEYSGLDTTTWKDQSTQARGSGTSHATGSTGTTTAANELVFTADSHIGGTSTPTVSTYTIRQSQTSGSLVPLASADKRVTATGTQSATWSWNNASWSAGIVTYIEAGAAPATKAPPPRRAAQRVIYRARRF